MNVRPSRQGPAPASSASAIEQPDAAPAPPGPRAGCYALASLLLQYPDPALQETREAVCLAAAVLRDPAQRAAVGRFLAYWSAATPAVLARDYVATFDLQKRCGLYLSHYLFGDRRQRGITFLRLKRLYEAAGLDLATPELPDYLPLMLEFAARAPDGYGEAVLQEFRAALELLRWGLHELESPYAHLLDAIVACLPRLTRAEHDAVRRLAAEGPPDELVGLEPFAPPEVMPVPGAAHGSPAAWPSAELRGGAAAGAPGAATAAGTTRGGATAAGSVCDEAVRR